MDSNNLSRTLSTVTIWAALAILGVTAMLTGTQVDFIMAAVAIGAGMMATIVIWESGKEAGKDQAEKAKRRGRLDQMLDRLNEDELAELRSRLIESDGEQVTLDDLLAERRRAK
ncbi:MAG: hypothetical protein BroJett038_13290 [Chloroflexota bacterium]|nr:MAG: hypothetical protein BroJett038_13290 [Chloroflexota bacterium]